MDKSTTPGSVSAVMAGRTNVPRPTSPPTRPRRAASEYARVTVGTVTPSASANSRCGGNRSPADKRPDATSRARAVASAS